MSSAKKKALGRGLDALLAPNPGDAARVAETPSPAAAPSVPTAPEAVSDEGRILQLDPQALNPNPKQPRSVFNEEALQELTESIRRDGVQEPVIVRKVGDLYELVSGERRVRASIMADRDTVPAICKDVSDSDMLKFGLIENIQREDLNAIELAEAYQGLVDEFGWTQEQVATEVGKKRATVTNTLRLLNLPGEVREYVATGSLTMGHARAILALDTQEAQSKAARKVITLGLSVRQTEKMADPPKAKSPKVTQKDPNIVRIEDDLRRSLGTRVNLRATQPDRGRIEIEYFSLDELERILDVLRGK